MLVDLKKVDLNTSPELEPYNAWRQYLKNFFLLHSVRQDGRGHTITTEMDVDFNVVFSSK